MYRDAGGKQRAAANPSEHDKPFPKEKEYGGVKKAKNDPVGRQEFDSNAYGEDRRLNWIDRS